MLPMGWNQIRQARVPDVQQHSMPYGQPQHNMMPNHQPYEMYHPPPIMPQHQMYPPHMMGNYGLQEPQMVIGNLQKPPEPEGPPPPSPPAPLPTGEGIPPPPPDDGKWWEVEVKNLPNNQQKHELERMVGEKWFQTMTTSQQIECWQHKLQLLNKQKKGNDGGMSQTSKPQPIVPAPSVSAPSTFKSQQPLPKNGNVDQDLQKAREEESGIKQQVMTFERQYGEWKKQFDDWKDKHKSHPNKQQFAQYENQWMTWQKQMSDQKSEYETSLKRVQSRILELEHQKAEASGSGNMMGRSSFQRPREQTFVNETPTRFPVGQNVQQQAQTFGPGPQFRPEYNSGQRPRFAGSVNQEQRFSRPQFDNNQGPGLNQRFSTPGNMDNNNSFQQRPLGGQNSGVRPKFNDNPALRFFENQGQGKGLSENSGPRQKFGGPRGGGLRFGARGNASGPRPRGPVGRRFRNNIPPLMSEADEYSNNWEEEDADEEGFQQDFFCRNQGLRGPRPGFSRRGRFPGPNQRMSQPRALMGNTEFQGPRPRFPNSAPRGRFPGPRGPWPPPYSEGSFADDDIPEDNHFYVEADEEKIEREEKEDFDIASSHQDLLAEEEETKADSQWEVTRDMVPLEFGSKKRKESYKIKQEAFTFHDVHKEKKIDQISIKQEVDTEGKDGPSKGKDNSGELAPEDDYSHYDTDEYVPEAKRQSPWKHGLPPRGRGRGGLPPFLGRGRGFPGQNRCRELEYEDDFLFEDVAKPPHVLRREDSRFRIENIRRLAARSGMLEGAERGGLRGTHRNLLAGAHYGFLDDLLPARDHQKREPMETGMSSSQKPLVLSETIPTVATSSSSGALDTEAIMQKAKELSNLDIKNLLSAVKSIKGADASKSEEPLPVTSIANSDAVKRRDKSDIRKGDEEAAILARERHYEQLARGIKKPSLRRPAGGQLGRDRLTEADLVAAGLDPVSLGLRDEDLLLQEYLLNPTSVRGPIRDPVVRDPLLDPLLQESLLEREILMREIQEMRKREEARQREEALREQELREALAKPILQAQKIVETIDYSHGLKDKDEEKGVERGRSPLRGSPGHDPPYMSRGPYPDFDGNRRRFPPMSMDERMRMRERDERIGIERGLPPPHPMEERLMRERGLWKNRSSSPYDPNSSVVVADDVGEALEKHWQLLDRERQSMERRRTSMERRRNSLERMRSSREREEERRDRERSLERLRRMERELKDRERILNERERRLKSPKRARDQRDRSSWKPEGLHRSRTPPRRRFEEERRSRERRRSPSPRRARGRSPVYDRRGRSPRDRSPRRSPFRERSRDARDRRRFSSPSGDPSRTRSPRPPPPRSVKPVCVRVEDLLNDPARQQRPKRIVIILRGLPGSGKSHIAKLIRDKESAKGVTPRLLGLDDYFMVENEKFEKDPDTGKIVKRKVHEYEYEAVMEPKYRQSLLKAFKKTLEDGFFNFVIVDAVNDKVSHFSEFWTIAKKCVFEVYVAELTADAHVCVRRNTHKRELSEIQEIANSWEETPAHMIRLDVRQMVQDSEIQEVEMGDISDEENNSDAKNEKLTLEQMAGIPQSKWELMEANERLDKLDGIKKKKLTSSQQDMAEFLSVTDDYVQRSSAPGKKRVRWADIEERSTQQRLREVGFVVGQTDWNRLVDGATHAAAALNRTKFI